MSGGRCEAVAVRGQLLRRGGVRRVRAHGREGARAAHGRGGGGEDAGGRRIGEGVEARRDRGRVGPTARAGVREEVARIEDGRHKSLRGRNGLHGQQPHCVLHQATSSLCGVRGGPTGLEMLT